jgi:hypothetical protein
MLLIAQKFKEYFMDTKDEIIVSSVKSLHTQICVVRVVISEYDRILIASVGLGYSS